MNRGICELPYAPNPARLVSSRVLSHAPQTAASVAKSACLALSSRSECDRTDFTLPPAWAIESVEIPLAVVQPLIYQSFPQAEESGESPELSVPDLLIYHPHAK